MDLLSSASLSESVTSTRAAFRRLKSELFGGAFPFPTGSRSPCCSTRSIPIDGITKEKQLHFLDLTERLFGLKNQTSLSPTKCRARTNEGTEPKDPGLIDYALMRQALIRLPETDFFTDAESGEASICVVAQRPLAGRKSAKNPRENSMGSAKAGVRSDVCRMD
jgi:hypothetical protein